jgi:putative hydrolase of the HAD superfamily
MRFVDSVRCRDDVTNVKPDPELFLASAKSLGVRPDRCMAIEDSANGVTAATRAGMFCVVVTNPMTTDMAVGHADLRLNALSDMPLAKLLKRACESH